MWWGNRDGRGEIIYSTNNSDNVSRVENILKVGANLPGAVQRLHNFGTATSRGFHKELTECSKIGES